VCHALTRPVPASCGYLSYDMTHIWYVQCDVSSRLNPFLVLIEGRKACSDISEQTEVQLSCPSLAKMKLVSRIKGDSSLIHSASCKLPD
jgi:hypothetical protein